jgi:hypothetical protein
VCEASVCSLPPRCNALTGQTDLVRVTLAIGNGAAPIETLCDFKSPDGPWALVHNSVGKEGKTLAFWQIAYADRLMHKGIPDVEENYYAGELFLVGKTYRDTIVDLAGKSVLALEATTSGLDPMTMHFANPVYVAGSDNVYKQNFAAGWSSADHDGDTFPQNCAVSFSGVTQHYGTCWAYNLGANEAGIDAGWGPHLNSTTAAELGLRTDGSAYTRVARVSRWTKW